jgi:hypothetical protein
MALYAVESSPAFGYPKRECLHDEEVKFMNKFTELVRNSKDDEGLFSDLIDPNNGHFRGMYAMADIDKL